MPFMNNNDMNIAIRFSINGGQVVVKDINGITQSTTTATKSLKQLDTAGNESAKGLSKAANSSKQLSTALQENESTAASLAGSLRTMVGVTAGLYAAFQSLAGIKALIERADEFNVLQQRIRTATDETKDYNAVSAEMFAIAQRNGTALAPTVELFQRLSTSRKDLKATNDQMLDFTDAVQKLGVIGGSSTSALEAGLMQLSQGLSGGVLRAEEFNSLLENIPELASRIGKGMDDIGKSENELGLGDLRKLVLEGKLLSNDVLRSILVQLPEIEKQFAKMPLSVGRASTMVDNSFSSALSRLDSITGATSSWANTLGWVSKTLDDMNAEELQDAVAILLSVGGAAGALAVLSRYNLSLKAIVLSSLSVTTSTVQKTAALLGLSSAAGVATRQITLLGAASSVANKAMALIGGPAGLALAAGTAIYYMASSAKDAAKEAGNLYDETEQLTAAMEKMTANQAKKYLQDMEPAFQKATKDARIYGAQIETLNRNLKMHPGNKDVEEWRKSLVAAQANLDTVNQTLTKYIEQKRIVDEFIKNGKKDTPKQEPVETTALNEELLKLYNTQMLNAKAIDALGRALTGVDLDLFKAQFIEATTLPANAAAAIKKFAEEAKTATANLNADTYLQQLREELKLLDLRLSKGQQSADMQKKLQQFTGANPAALAALQRELLLIEKKQALVTDKETLASLKKETELLQIRLAKGEKEYEVQKALYQLKGGDPAVIAEIENQIRVQQKLKDQIELTEQISSGAFDKMLDDMTAMNGIATNIGDVLVQAFGSVAQQLDAMTESQLQYNEKVKELAGEKAKLNILDKNSAAYAKGKAAIDEKEAKLKNDYYQSQMGHFASLTGAASKMFSEQSKGRQVLHKLEVTFAAIETALALKKAAANALTAITNQGGGDPYSAFARIAAMAALMAGLGVFSGSAGGGVSAEDRQKSQGTGTVLGDDSAKSESIANALGRIEDLELDQYAELRSINGSIRELSAGIKNLAVNLVASYGRFNESNYPGELGKDYNLQLGSGLASMVGGGVIGLVADKLLGGLVGGLTNKLLGGLFGSKKTELVDSGLSFAAQELGDIISSGLMNATVYDVIKTTKKKLFGLSKSTSESTEYRAIDNALRAEFSRIFSHMGKSVTEAVNLLGLETNKMLESFVINLPALSFKDLKGDEIEKELQAMFSQQGDLMVQYLVPGIAEFQKMGEGLYDTLIRVAQEQAVFNSALDNLGLQLSRFAGVTKAIELEVAQSIIELMGGIEQFQSATADYFAEFYSEQEQLAAITKSATAQFASLGVAMPSSRDGFKALVDSLDLTTDAGQRMFAALMALVPAMDQFYDAAERAKREAEEAAEKAKKEAEAKAEAERKLAEDRAAYISDLQSQLARLDMSSLALALDDIKKWYDAQIKEARELGASTALLEQLYARKRQQIIDQELTRINEDTERQMSALSAEHERSVSELTQQYDQLFSAMRAAGDGIAAAILDIQRSMAGWDESGYQSGRIGDLRSQLGTGDIAAQVKTIEQLQAAIVARYQADLSTNTALMDAANAKLEALSGSWQELTAALGNVRAGISSAILDIKRSMSGWDEAGYQSGQVTQLRDQLGRGSVLDQINTIEKLQSAVVGRYQAELSANEQLRAAADQRYSAELSAHKALADAARQLLSAADALRLSDLSPALMGDQFKEAQSQFKNLLSRAQGGDASAMQALQQSGGSYLKLAQDYFASGSSEYAAIFAEVEQAYRSFGGMASAAEPAVPSAVLAYQSAATALQEDTIKELESLQKLLDDLEAKAAAEQKAKEDAAKAELAAYQAKQLELQTGAITELAALQTLLGTLEAQANLERQTAVDALVAKLDEQKAALLDAAERQIAAIKALQTAATSPVVTNPKPIDPIIIPPGDTPPIIIQPPKDDRIWLPEYPGDPAASAQVVELLQTQLTEQRKANAQQQRQMAILQAELQRTQNMLYETRRLA